MSIHAVIRTSIAIVFICLGVIGGFQSSINWVALPIGLGLLLRWNPARIAAIIGFVMLYLFNGVFLVVVLTSQTPRTFHATIPGLAPVQLPPATGYLIVVGFLAGSTLAAGLAHFALTRESVRRAFLDRG